MKHKLGKFCFGLAASAVLLAVNPAANAQDKTYLNCANGGAVKDPFGNCIVSRGGSAIPECMGVVDEKIMISLAADANFAFDKSNLKPAGKATLDDFHGKLQEAEQVSGIDIVGHTDSIGSEAYNQGLSERRASAAANYLVSKGTNPGIITARGMGELQPIATNDTEEGRAQNRRVDITADAKIIKMMNK